MATSILSHPFSPFIALANYKQPQVYQTLAPIFAVFLGHMLLIIQQKQLDIMSNWASNHTFHQNAYIKLNVGGVYGQYVVKTCVCDRRFLVYC